jgi:hypothetical protein
VFNESEIKNDVGFVSIGRDVIEALFKNIDENFIVSADVKKLR